MKRIGFIFFSLSLLLFGCKEPDKKDKRLLSEEEIKETMVNANQQSVRLEDEDIDLYIKRQQLDIVKTETGLRYQITKQGKGPLIKAKNLVTIGFETLSINGEPLYSSEESGPKVLEIEKNNEIPALDEMLKLMNLGAESHMVIPSHLAYGVAGDGDKIRQRIPIVMKIKVLNIEK